MDALTSLELEAQRRRETVASDRDLALARATGRGAAVDPAMPEIYAMTRPAAVTARRPTEPDCQPAPLARQSAG